MTYQDIVTAINLKHDELDALDDSNYGSPEYRRNKLRHEIITKEILVLIKAKYILRDLDVKKTALCNQ